MVLSVLVALILTPALCATLLKKPQTAHADRGGLFGWFNRNFDRSNRKYTGIVDAAVRHPIPPLLLFAGIVGVMGDVFLRLSPGFLPPPGPGAQFIQGTAPPRAPPGLQPGVLGAVGGLFSKSLGTICGV